MLMVCLSMGWDEERWMWLLCNRMYGPCLCLLYTSFLQGAVTSCIAEPTNPFSTASTHQTHCSSRRHGLRDCFVHLFSKVSHDETRKNMKDRRVRGFGVSAKFVTWALKCEKCGSEAPIQNFPWWKTKPKEERRKEDGTVGSPVIPKRTPG